MDMGSYVADRTDKDVLEVLEGFQGERQPLMVSASEIARRMGCTTRTVQNAIVRLERKGKIKIFPKKGRPTCYLIVSP